MTFIPTTSILVLFLFLIQLYTDKVELVNSLGSKKSKHKVTVFYWTLMNLPPHLRSSLRSIRLLGAINSNLLIEHGIPAFLQSTLQCMAEWASGVTLNIRGRNIKMYGILLNSTGYLPASNVLGGFKASVSKALRPCRCCDVFTYNRQVDELRNENLSKAARERFAPLEWQADCARLILSFCVTFIPTWNPCRSFLVLRMLFSFSVMIWLFSSWKKVYFLRNRFSFIVKPLGKFLAVKPSGLEFNTPIQSFFYKNKSHVVPNYCHVL